MKTILEQQLMVVATSNEPKGWALVNRVTREPVAAGQVKSITIIGEKPNARVIVEFVDIPIDIKTKPTREKGSEPGGQT